MKFFSYIFLIAISFLTACKKDSFDPDKARLQKVIFSYNNQPSAQTISYDASGRIVKVTRQGSDNSEVIVAIISYTANEIIIHPKTEPALQEQHEIKFQLNTLNQPLLRKEISSFHFYLPDGHVQDNYSEYESIYQYGPTGLLTKMNTSKYDSIWYFLPAQNWNYNTKNISEVTEFFYGNNNLTQIKSIATVSTESRNAVGNINTLTTTEDNAWDFEYGKKQPNKTDFSNNLVIRELKLFNTEWYPFNPQLSYFPNKITFSESVNNTRSVTEFHADYNKHGFISAVIMPQYPESKYYFVYN